MPALGFGVYAVPPEETERVVTDALAAGYRHLDTAAAYENEAAVGRAIAASGIPRDELFITTKLWVADAGEDNARRAFDRSLQRLGLDRLDLYLIHQPFGDYYGSWRAMEKLHAEGAARAIGVSNFPPRPAGRPHRPQRRHPRGRPDRGPPVLPAHHRSPGHGRARRAARGMGTPRPGPQRPVHPPGAHRDRPSSRQDRRAGGPALAAAARHRRHPQVRPARADAREPRRVR